MVEDAVNGGNDKPSAEDTALEFPCRFPVKAMGLNADDFCDHVLHLLREYSAHFDASELQLHSSRTGRYLSITLVIEAQSKAQLDAIYQILSEDARVLVAL
jgi:putative lipoic acid-binding regulatory protein